MDDIDRIDAQHREDADARLWRAMAPLRSVVSFMNTGAHPDDEITALLAALALRDGVNVSVACGTRGEGGQNALGPETGRDLGVIRTREMERAAAVLGMSLYWLSEGPDDPIVDFGFSKSGVETLGAWGRERLLERFVTILRRERPDIVCPTFLDVPGQHGHHRAMTQAAFDAVDLAADPAHVDGLPPWQVAKLYLPAWSGAGDSYDDDESPPPATVTVDVSGADPVLGADYVQIAEWSRACHRTQGMGRWIEPGGRHYRPLHLAVSALGESASERAITDGLPQTLGDLGYARAQSHIDACLSAWPDRDAIASSAAAALGALGAHGAPGAPGEQHTQDVRASAPNNEHRVAAKRRQLAKVVALARGLEPSLTVTPAILRPGDTAQVTLRLPAALPGQTHRVLLPSGWALQGDTLSVPGDAPPNNPMPPEWHPDRPNAGVGVSVCWRDGDTPIELVVDADPRPVVLPAASATLVPSAIVHNLAASTPLSVRIVDASPGQCSVDSTHGWIADVQSDVVRLVPEQPQPGLVALPLRIGGQAAATLTRMDYSHTGHLVRPSPAQLRISTLHAAWPSARIGYIPGGSDRVDERLTAAGCAIERLDDARLASVDFSAFDTVLVGIFAARSNAVLGARIADLHAWVRAGGTLVTLYHRPWDNWSILPLAPVTIGKPSLRWRVTDETAAVTLLEPDNSLFQAPNAIGEADWAGWHKERGLYFAADWEAPYRPLLSMADPGEAPHRGALLEGRFGQGVHRHTALILHHQLDELVGGAYRLMANLLTPIDEPG